MKKFLSLVFSIWMSVTLSAQSQDLFYVKGMAELLKGNLDNAILSLTDAIDHNNSDERYYLNRADAFLKQGKYNQALEDYEEATAFCQDAEILGLPGAMPQRGTTIKPFNTLQAISVRSSGCLNLYSQKIRS